MSRAFTGVASWGQIDRLVSIGRFTSCMASLLGTLIHINVSAPASNRDEAAV